MSKELNIDWPYKSCAESCPLVENVNIIINNEIKLFCGKKAKEEVYTEEKINVECKQYKSKRRIYYDLKLYRDDKLIKFQAGGVGTTLCPRSLSK